MRRVFALDVFACPRCGGRLRVIAIVKDPAVVRTLLAHGGRARATAAPGPPPRPRWLALPLGQTCAGSRSSGPGPSPSACSLTPCAPRLRRMTQGQPALARSPLALAPEAGRHGGRGRLRGEAGPGRPLCGGGVNRS